MSKTTDSILEKQARKLRHRVVIRDREGGAWLSQIYQNTFTGADAYVFFISHSLSIHLTFIFHVQARENDAVVEIR